MLPLKFNKIYVFPLIGSRKIDRIKFTPKIEMTAPKKNSDEKISMSLTHRRPWARPINAPERVKARTRRRSVGLDPAGAESSLC